MDDHFQACSFGKRPTCHFCHCTMPRLCHVTYRTDSMEKKESFFMQSLFWGILYPILLHICYTSFKIGNQDSASYFVCLFLCTPCFEGQWVCLHGILSHVRDWYLVHTLLRQAWDNRFTSPTTQDGSILTPHNSSNINNIDAWNQAGQYFV